MEFLCLIGFIGVVWWAVASHRSTRVKAPVAHAPAAPPAPVVPPAPPWRVSQSLALTRDWLWAVRSAADAAHGAGAAVPLPDIYASVDEGQEIVRTLTTKIDALRRTRGDQWWSLPAETQRILDSDAARLDQLNHSLSALRDDITNMTAAVGWSGPRIESLEDHLRATRYALRQFPDEELPWRPSPPS